jgi:hypothetical protein
MKKSRICRLFFIMLFCLFISMTAQSQHFGDKCIGEWQGTMYIFGKGAIKDSVLVTLIVSKLSPTSWKWKTEYHSPVRPMVKDYVLRMVDANIGKYVIDEGNGIELSDFLFGNKLLSIFETGGILLTSSYELVADNLVFEVTSRTKEPSKHPEIRTYSISNVQRVTFKRKYN